MYSFNEQLLKTKEEIEDLNLKIDRLEKVKKLTNLFNMSFFIRNL